MRLFGIQEPASALFSLLNLIATYLAWAKYARSTAKYAAKKCGWLILPGQFKSSDPYYSHVTANAFLSMNAWLWSMIFHSHDTYFTEKMDYFSAYFVILSSLYLILVKTADEKLRMMRRGRRILHISIFIPLLSFYIYHVYYLAFVNFDYGYNMKVNLATGKIYSEVNQSIINNYHSFA